MMQTKITWNSEIIPRYVLGTAQIGLNYGIANVTGKPDYNEAFSIIQTAYCTGVRFFDTAQAYGDSEKILGDILKNLGISGHVSVITKLSPHHDLFNHNSIKQSIIQSQKNLGVKQIWGLLLHTPTQLSLLEGGLGNLLQELKKNGLIRYLGVSVYTLHETEQAIRHPQIDLIQAPCNLWSPDLLINGIFALAEKYNKLIFIRSIFLQGLLLMNPDQVFQLLPIAKEASEIWEKTLLEFGNDRQEVCMRFAASLPFPVIIGAENRKQVKNNFFCLHSALTRDEILLLHQKIMPYLKPNIIDPRRWNDVS